MTPRFRLAAAIICALVIAGSAVAAGIGISDVTGSLRAMLLWAQRLEAGGWVLFALVQVAVVASGVLPASLAGIAAGAVYGVALGFGLAATSTIAGAVLTLGLSRSLARGWIERLMAGRPRLRDLDRMLAADGARLVCLLRLSPVMPFAATSYMLGLSSVSVRAYVLGTLGSLPALLGYVVLGRIVGSGVTSDAGGWLRWGTLAVGAVATAVLTVHLGRLVRRAGFMSSPVDLTTGG